ncbi:hypothetical protein [Allosphingosinicella deserti]|uniref:Uncharacterized protein n=1 Tax=Allosphingosinicella deserti TaxID=2116704 RepID=A0A2P7QM70_9SPHN|nr:hypothetical protein [Sphingomonas deserti]PSJ39041.1 hypothetical protein C7I55_17245 [Sphingomonas deserti]
MAMTDAEAARLVTHLEAAVRQFASEPTANGILDVLNQWRSDVEAGRQVERKLKVRQSPGIDELAGVPRGGATTTGDFVGKEEYSNFEQLDMLVAALGVAFLAPKMMASRVIGMVKRSIPPATAAQGVVVHRVGVGDDDATEVVQPISSVTIAQSDLATLKLGRLLDEISREAGLPSRQFTSQLGTDE